MSWAQDIIEQEQPLPTATSSTKQPPHGFVFWRDLQTPEPDRVEEFYASVLGVASPFTTSLLDTMSFPSGSRRPVGGLVKSPTLAWRSWLRCPNFDELRARIRHENTFEPGCIEIVADVEHSVFGEVLAVTARGHQLVFVETAAGVAHCAGGQRQSQLLRRTIASLDTDDRSLLDTLRRPFASNSMGMWPAALGVFGLLPDLWGQGESPDTAILLGGQTLCKWRATSIVEDPFGLVVGITVPS